MKEILLLAILMLTKQLTFCQEIYPQKICIDNDTIIAISIEQARSINVTYSDLEYFKEVSQDCYNFNDSLVYVIAYKDTLYKEISEIYTLSDSSNKKLSNSLHKCYGENLTLIDKKDKLLFQRNVFAGISAILLVILLL